METETGAAAPSQSGSKADSTGDSEPVAVRPAPKKSDGYGRTDARPNPDSPSKVDVPSAGEAGEPPPRATQANAEPAGN